MASPLASISAQRASDRFVVSIPDAALHAAVGEVAGVRFIEWDLTSPAPEHVDIVVQPYMSDPVLLARLEGMPVRLVQGQMIGYDGVSAHLPVGIPFANAASVHEASTAELALTLILSLQRGIPDFVRAGDEGVWAPLRHASLADRTVLLLGYGGVGRSIEQRLTPFEVNLIRVARTARTVDNGRIYALDELDSLLPRADIVVIAVPLGQRTRHLVDKIFLAKMPDGAMLVNVSRGPIVVTDALTREVVSGRLRAALDVTDPEPLPAGHPLWSAPGTLITPHVGGRSSAMMPRIAALIRAQVAHIQRGSEPVNVVISH